MSNYDKLLFSVKLNDKSISSKGWSIKREFTYDLIPKLPYEEECDIILDGIKAKARLNVQPRLFYKTNQRDLINHIQYLIDENKHERIEIEMLLNKSEYFNFENINELYFKLNHLEYINKNNKFKITKLKEYIDFLEHDNEKLHRNLLISEQNNLELKEKIDKLVK